jgi:hypothetical protein
MQFFFVFGFEECKAAAVVEEFGAEVCQAVLSFLCLFGDEFLLGGFGVVV